MPPEPTAVPAGPAVPECVRRHFPGARLLEAVVAAQSAAARSAGFDPEATIAVTAACRDEIVAPLRAEVRSHWHRSFDFSSLSGLPLAGVTGMRAVLDHAPQAGPVTHVAVVAMPHIGILADGTTGLTMRRGRVDPTTACGSLRAAAQWAAERNGQPTDGEFRLDPADPEQSLVRAHLVRDLPDLLELDPVGLVARVAELMVTDVWSLVEQVTDATTVDVAVMSAVLVHGPEQVDYAAAGPVEVRVGGERRLVPGQTAAVSR